MKLYVNASYIRLESDDKIDKEIFEENAELYGLTIKKGTFGYLEAIALGVDRAELFNFIVALSCERELHIH